MLLQEDIAAAANEEDEVVLGKRTASDIFMEFRRHKTFM
jgi:hypothetical protein